MIYLFLFIWCGIWKIVYYELVNDGIICNFYFIFFLYFVIDEIEIVVMYKKWILFLNIYLECNIYDIYFG